jgi:integrating conjugative element protein (TIGR03758 family)
MATPSAVTAAFSAGAGISGSSAQAVIVVVLAAVTLIWWAWTVFGIGTQVMDQEMTASKGAIYIGRSTVLVMLVVFYLVR